jgi:hypothetical protein
MLHVVALATALMAAAPSATVRTFPHIRTTSPLLASLIDDAQAHSPTFARQIETLKQSDVIVYFEPSPQMEARFRGRVHFMGASGGVRYLRLQVRTTLNRYDIIASIAHELQHAIEISCHPEVIDESSLAALYRRIGDEHEWCMFETEEAVQAGRAVRTELLEL